MLIPPSFSSLLRFLSSSLLSFHGTCVWNCPGTVMLMTPPHMHISFELLLRAGILPIKTVGEPGIHGAIVLGTQGPGVKIGPFQLDGFAGELHTPKGRILTMGLLSIMVAAGFDEINTFLSGKTMRGTGATPKVHIMLAVAHTHMPIGNLLLVWEKQVKMENVK